MPDLIPSFQEHWLEGLLYVSGRNKPLAHALPGPGIPKLLVICFDDLRTPSVVPDGEAGRRHQGHR